jgi:putative ABC transport system permease protein
LRYGPRRLLKTSGLTAIAVISLAMGSGVALGLVSAYGLTKYLESRMKLSQRLYGARLSDPLPYGMIAVSLTMVALSACYIPARRAMRVAPLVALRCD